MSTKTTIVLELTAKEAQDLMIIVGGGISWNTPEIGDTAFNVWLALAGVAREPEYPGYHKYASFMTHTGEIIGGK